MIAFAGMTAIAALTFVAVVVLWLRKLRQTVAAALSQSANQQMHTMQRLGEAIAQVQNHQKTYEQQLHNLAQAGVKLRQELTAVAQRVEQQHAANPGDLHGDRTVH